MSEVLSKVCTTCGEDKLLSQYSRDKSKRLGVASQCKACRSVVMSNNYQKNKDKILSRQRKYIEENRDKVLEGKARWRRNNADRQRSYKAAYYRSKMAEDPEFRCKTLVSKQIKSHLKSRGASKSRATVGILPYTIAELYAHLLSTIPHGYTERDFMSGRLHIDHIVPQSSFHFTSDSDEELCKCWALSNLRLLPAAINVWKSNRNITCSSSRLFAVARREKMSKKRAG